MATMDRVKKVRPGLHRARVQSAGIGGEITQARTSLVVSRARLAAQAGVSPDTVRRIEAGDPAVQVDTLCAVAHAVGLDLVLRVYPSTRRLRDSGQLRLAEILRRLAAPSWHARAEMPAGDHGEAVDLVFLNATEILCVEIDRRLVGLEDRLRRYEAKRLWMAARHQRAVRLVLAVEDTAGNRSAMAEHAPFVRSVLPAGTREVLRALRTGRPLGRDGLVWIRRRSPPAGADGRLLVPP